MRMCAARLKGSRSNSITASPQGSRSVWIAATLQGSRSKWITTSLHGSRSVWIAAITVAIVAVHFAAAEQPPAPPIPHEPQTLLLRPGGAPGAQDRALAERPRLLANRLRVRGFLK
jgi:hypothetical protein